VNRLASDWKHRNTSVRFAGGLGDLTLTGWARPPHWWPKILVWGVNFNPPPDQFQQEQHLYAMRVICNSLLNSSTRDTPSPHSTPSAPSAPQSSHLRRSPVAPLAPPFVPPHKRSWALSNFSPTRGFDFAYWKIVKFNFQHYSFLSKRPSPFFLYISHKRTIFKSIII